ncbi:MAG: hypothetical protein K8R45_15440 [Desulfobacterales bacterium]|nr:hypothetical protein [Desulfobacterales bacterium]
MDQKRSLLNRAALRGRFIPLESLKKGFPRNDEGMILAYEESKSFVAHITSKYGKEGILSVLEGMKNAEAADAAVLKALSAPLRTLEKEWHESLSRKMTWFTYLSYHLYDILFALMGLIAMVAFVKIILRKRAYIKEEMEDGP